MRKVDRKLSHAELEQFGAEIEAIRQKHLADVGERDAKYITKIEKAVRYTEIAGRGLLMAGIFPPAFILGTLTLGVSKILENMELGHNVMHGQYDFMNNKRLTGQTYEWDTWCTADNWRYSHNYRHHTYTNVLGEDHDIGYGVLRLFPEQKWEPRFLANVPLMVILATFFENLLALQTLELEKVINGEKTLKETKDRAIPTFKKAGRQIVKDYVFFPLLAGPFFLPVLAGNFIANIIRNYWTFVIIFCGHFTADSEVFDKSIIEGESQAHWYLRQLKGSSNLTGGKLFHIMSGNLSHQIEHHLFPEVPAHRYAEMSVEVQEICKRYGQHYNKASLFKQFSTVVGRAFKYSLPSLKRKNQEPVAA
ncbi:MAG: acyl-CoA desaturase [Limnobacter sp.]|uniref:fatty acid desaturase family protein n=1 Tax=Limnobacter sp. TaxID=2003368 RepID=UPI0032EC2848